MHTQNHATSWRDEYWDELLDDIVHREVLPIVGPELVTVTVDGVRTPLYRHMADMLAEQLEIDVDHAVDRPDHRVLSDVANRYVDRALGNRDIEAVELYGKLARLARTCEPFAIPDALLRLVEIACFRVFVTTAVDTTLERALNDVRFRGQRASHELGLSFHPRGGADLPVSIEELQQPCVYHLFGTLSNGPDCVVSDEDMVEFVHALHAEHRRPRNLFDAVTGQHLILLGTGLSGWLARFFIRLSKRDRLSQSRHRIIYIADRHVLKDASLLEFLNTFCRIRIFDDGGAEDFVSQLHRRWMARRPAPRPESQRPAAGRMKRGSVFLSYAREDVDVVQQIRTTLDAAGVDVWFDAERLEAGDDFSHHIDRDIAGCSLFVPIISRHSLAATPRFCHREWYAAIERAKFFLQGSAFIVPIIIDDSTVDHDQFPLPFKEKHCVTAPAGRLSGDIVDTVKRRYRAAQKMETVR